MQRGRDGEIVSVGVVAVGAVEVVGVAGEDELGGQGRGARDLVGVVLRLRAVEGGRVERLRDVVEDRRPGAESGEGVQ